MQEGILIGMSKKLVRWGMITLLVVVGAALSMWWLHGYLEVPASAAGAMLRQLGGGAGFASALRPEEPIVVAPKSAAMILSVIESLPEASTFLALMDFTGATSQLRGAGPYSVFVPADDAFARLAPNALSNMTFAEKKRLAQNHIVKGRVITSQSAATGSVKTASKDTLEFAVEADGQSVRVGRGWVLSQFTAQNGVVYVINAVLVPTAKNH